MKGHEEVMTFELNKRHANEYVPPTPEQTNNRTNDLITNNDVMRDLTNRLGAKYSSSQTN